MWYGNHGHNRIRSGPRQQIDGGIDVLRATEGRCGLQQHQDLGAIRFTPVERSDEVKEDIEHRCVVAREMLRTQERHISAERPSRGRDLLILRAHDNSREGPARARRIDGIGDERPAAEEGQVLARNRLGAAARRNDAKDGQY